MFDANALGTLLSLKHELPVGSPTGGMGGAFYVVQ
jgi:hypothetical protein